eukprot:364282-Chlamydomonas_euryale.AAC.54
MHAGWHAIARWHMRGALFLAAHQAKSTAGLTQHAKHLAHCNLLDAEAEYFPGKAHADEAYEKQR